MTMSRLRIHKQSKAQAYWMRNPDDRNRRDSLDDYADITEQIPQRDGEKLCAFCATPTYTFERCTWCNADGEAPEVTVRV